MTERFSGNMMHWRDGWMFTRRANGDVTIERTGAEPLCITIPASEWVSLIHHLAGDNSAEHFGEAFRFHGIEVGAHCR